MDYRQKNKQLFEQAVQLYATTDRKGGIALSGTKMLPWDKLPNQTIPQDGNRWGNWKLTVDNYPSLDFEGYEIYQGSRVHGNQRRKRCGLYTRNPGGATP